MKEREFDDLLREALVAAAAGRYESAADSEMIVTAPYQRRFAKMLRDPHGYARRYREGWGGRIGRYAMTAVITLAVLGATIFAIPQTRAIAINILSQWHEKYVSFIFGSNALPQELPEITIGYIPEGYELLSQDSNIDGTRLLFKYTNAEKYALYIDVIAVSGKYKTNYDNEHRTIHYITLDNGLDALYLEGDSIEWLNALIWSSADNKLVFEVVGRLSKEELLEIAAGIKI